MSNTSSIYPVIYAFVGDPGELVGKRVKGDPMREFDGYANKEATQKKLAYDVFTKGDCYFLTGMQNYVRWVRLLNWYHYNQLFVYLCTLYAGYNNSQCDCSLRLITSSCCSHSIYHAISQFVATAPFMMSLLS